LEILKFRLHAEQSLPDEVRSLLENEKSSGRKLMRMKLIAASLLALGIATSVSYAQSSPGPVPNAAAADKNMGEDTGGGAGNGAENGGAAVVDPTATHSTSDMTKCKDGSNTKGNLQTQAGKSGATPQGEACGENNN
jgi:hypothetical protein